MDLDVIGPINFKYLVRKTSCLQIYWIGFVIVQEEKFVSIKPEVLRYEAL